MTCVADASRMMPVSGCPRVSWEEEVAAAVPRASPQYINVGANKGYNAASFLGLWSRHRIGNKDWHHAILLYARTQNVPLRASVACGMCKACNTPLAREHGRRGGHAHLLDLSPSNFGLLSWLVAHFNLSDAVRVHELGASNASGSAMLRADKIVGAEDLSLGAGAKGQHSMKAVPIVRLDDFLSAHGISHPYHISIDAEGWDSLVLEGLQSSLSRRRVALLEFEYSGAGYWSAAHSEARTLERTLSWLDSMSYRCFWQARHALIPATRPCWRAEFETHSWSNLVCAHEPRVLAVLNGIAQEGSRRRERMCKGVRMSRMSRSYRRAWCGFRGGALAV